MSQTPRSPDERPRTLHVFAVLGTAVQVVILAYLLTLTAAMSLDFYQGQESGPIENPGELLRYILATTALAGSMGVLGLILNLFTATVGGYRARWFFFASLVLAILYILIIPLGTLLGPGFALWLLLRRGEFLFTEGQGV